MLPRMSQMKTRIIVGIFVPDPASVAFHVRRVRMPRHISVIAFVPLLLPRTSLLRAFVSLLRPRLTLMSAFLFAASLPRWAVGRNVSAADAFVAVLLPAVLLSTILLPMILLVVVLRVRNSRNANEQSAHG